MKNFKKIFVSAVIGAAVISFPAFAEEHNTTQTPTPHHPSHPAQGHEGQPSDAVKKELKDYHAKKKELRENLSPEAKDHLKKRYEKKKDMRKDRRKERREDRREDRKDRHNKPKDQMHQSNEGTGSEQGGQY